MRVLRLHNVDRVCVLVEQRARTPAAKKSLPTSRMYVITWFCGRVRVWALGVRWSSGGGWGSEDVFVRSGFVTGSGSCDFRSGDSVKSASSIFLGPAGHHFFATMANPPWPSRGRFFQRRGLKLWAKRVDSDLKKHVHVRFPRFFRPKF